MADEYIRLDTTIMGIDGLINEAPTGSQARALLCAKDMIYDQQRYVSEMKPVKHGYWEEEEPRVLKCSVCGEYSPMNYLGQNCIDSRYCPWCGTKMDSNADEPWQSE